MIPHDEYVLLFYLLLVCRMLFELQARKRFEEKLIINCSVFPNDLDWINMQ